MAVDPITAIVIKGVNDQNDPALPAITSGMIAQTPGAHPDVRVQVIQPIVAILIRFANAYFTMLVGLVSAGMTTNIIPASNFLHLVYACAQLSLAGAGLGLLKDCLTIFARLENKFPLATGNV